MPLRVSHAVTSGPHRTAEGVDIVLENNAWVIGDDEECLVVDAPHDAGTVVDLVAGRRVVAVACTHAHADHVAEAPAVGAPVLLHPADLPLWRLTHARAEPDGSLADSGSIRVGGHDVQVWHTPGHTPGSCCLYLADQDLLFTGDTLFPGGPGATSHSWGDFPTIITSIRERLFTLPDRTRVLPGHGAETTIGAERPSLDEWIARGW